MKMNKRKRMEKMRLIESKYVENEMNKGGEQGENRIAERLITEKRDE